MEIIAEGSVLWNPDVEGSMTHCNREAMLFDEASALLERLRSVRWFSLPDAKHVKYQRIYGKAKQRWLRRYATLRDTAEWREIERRVKAEREVLGV